MTTRGGRLRPRPVPDPDVRVVVTHHAGGSHLSYRPWVKYFPSNWEVLLTEAPGRGRLARVPAKRTIVDLVAHLVDELSPWTDRPLALFGHSVGALVSYELARALPARGLPWPVWLGVSAHGGPPESAADRPRAHQMSAAELRDVVARFGGLPLEVLHDDVLWSFVEPLLRNDLELAESWSPESSGAALPVPVPVTAFCGDADLVAGPEAVSRWSRYTSRFLGVRVHVGDHFYFRRDPQTLVAQVVSEVDSVLSGPAQLCQ